VWLARSCLSNASSQFFAPAHQYPLLALLQTSSFEREGCSCQPDPRLLRRSLLHRSKPRIRRSGWPFLGSTTAAVPMGDNAAQPGAQAEFSHDAPAAASAASAHTGPGRRNDDGHSPPSSVPQPQYQSHEQPAISPPAFVSQLDMAYQQRRTPFDMNAMANALPQGPYRTHPYNHGPPMPGAQFATPTTMAPMAMPQYYVPQHTHIGQFYTTPLAPQPPSTLPPRSDLGYYQSPVMMNQQLHAPQQYYYTPGGQFPAQGHHMQGQVALGQYGLPSMHQHPDPRSRQPVLNGHEGGPPSPIPHANGQPRYP
jgi:hypothetical protein